MGGVASGVTGIFMAPVKGARNEGVGGFFKGVGKGLVGAVVKPVMGVTEGVTAVVQGASNATDGKIVKHAQKRRRRAIPLLPRSGRTERGSRSPPLRRDRRRTAAPSSRPPLPPHRWDSRYFT